MGPLGLTGDQTDSVVDAACRAWEVNGEHPQVRRWSEVGPLIGDAPCPAIRSVLVLAPSRRLECVLDPDKGLAEAVDEVASLVDRGWDVSALLPIASMGAAHEVFRGIRMALQGWWTAGDSLRFSSPEAP